MDAIVYDEITTQIGLKDDVASATGSLHAKVKSANDSLATISSKNIMANNSVIKSVQRGIAAVGDVTSATVTISAVNTSKSIVILNAVAVASATAPGNIYLTYVTLTSATEITVTNQTIQYVGNIAWQVIEFY